MNDSPIDINLNISEIKNIVSLTITDNDNLSFSVSEDREIVHLTIKEEGENLNLCVTEGRDGLDVYQLWLKEGNSGTFEEFLETLKGEKGEPGPSIKKTSELINDGYDGVYPYISTQDFENLYNPDQWEITDW